MQISISCTWDESGFYELDVSPVDNESLAIHCTFSDFLGFGVVFYSVVRELEGLTALVECIHVTEHLAANFDVWLANGGHSDGFAKWVMREYLKYIAKESMN